jgi:hypothetical protein
VSRPNGIVFAAGIHAIGALVAVLLAVVNVTDSEINLAKVFYLPAVAAAFIVVAWGLLAHHRAAWIAALVISVVGSIALWGPLGVVPAGIMLWALLTRAARQWVGIS